MIEKKKMKVEKKVKKIDEKKLKKQRGFPNLEKKGKELKNKAKTCNK